MAAIDQQDKQNLLKVRLTNSADRTRRERVIFDVTPDLIENTNINYKSIDPVHAPGQILVYGSTSSRTFNISNIKLVSRTVAEADKNLRILWTLRGWRSPRFGRSTLDRDERTLREQFGDINFGSQEQKDQVFEYWKGEGLFGNELRGEPPAVLYLSAYSRFNSLGNQMEHINQVPVVINQLSIPYPSDVDYIPTSNQVPMPIIMNVDLTLLETHSPREYETFDLSRFKAGKLGNF